MCFDDLRPYKFERFSNIYVLVCLFMQLQLQQVSEHANTSLHQVQELEVSCLPLVINISFIYLLSYSPFILLIVRMFTSHFTGKE